MSMTRIDEPRLESDTGYRFGYVASFIGFGDDDIAAIHAAAEHLAPLVQMNALMGFVATTLTGAILALGLDRDTERRTLLAFTKLLWIQNDLIGRHYQACLAA